MYYSTLYSNAATKNAGRYAMLQRYMRKGIRISHRTSHTAKSIQNMGGVLSFCVIQSSVSGCLFFRIQYLSEYYLSVTLISISVCDLMKDDIYRIIPNLYATIFIPM